MGHEAFIAQMGAAMATFTQLQQATGADLGVLASPKPAAGDDGQPSQPSPFASEA